MQTKTVDCSSETLGADIVTALDTMPFGDTDYIVLVCWEDGEGTLAILGGEESVGDLAHPTTGVRYEDRVGVEDWALLARGELGGSAAALKLVEDLDRRASL